MFDWDRAFVNTNVTEKVFILNKTILNIPSKFIPHVYSLIYKKIQKFIGHY